MNKIKRIIYIGYYIPGDASSNFVVSFCKGYAQLGLKVKLLLLLFKPEYKPSIEGVDIIPVNLTGRVKRERIFSSLIKKYYIEGETVIQHYGCPSYEWLPFRKHYPSFFTIGEIPFANPNMPLHYKIMEWLQRLSTKKASGLLVQTNTLKEYYSNYGIKNIQVFNILIDPSRFQGLTRSEDSKYISYCGSVGVYKDGVNDLIDAFACVHPKHPDVKLRIIGPFFTPQDETILRKKVKDLDIDKQVVFTGKVLPEEMPSLLYNSVVLALARPNNKQAQYGFPSKLGEYLFTGNPVVVTRVGEIDHFLTDKESCVFAKPDNPADFAEKLDWVLLNQEEAKRIGENGKTVAQNSFSVLSQCKVALDFFERTINK